MREGGRERKEGRDRRSGVERGEGGEVREEMKEIKVDKFLELHDK